MQDEVETERARLAHSLKRPLTSPFWKLLKGLVGLAWTMDSFCFLQTSNISDHCFSDIVIKFFFLIVQCAVMSVCVNPATK